MFALTQYVRRTFFEKISEVSDDHAYSSRMRFMLKDLMDLRKCGWQSRRETEKAKKLSEIRSGGGESKTAAVAPPKPQDARNIRTAEPAADEWVTVTSSRRGSASSAPKSPVKEAVKASASKASSSMFGALGKETKKPSDKSKVKMESKTKKEPSRATPDIDVAPSPSPEDDENDDASPEAQEGTESAEDANVPELPGADGHLEKEDLRHVTNVVEEYFTNGLYSEALLSLRERVDPRGMGDVVRGLIVFVLEKKDEQRRKVATLLVDLYNDDFLTAETATAGVMSFLDVFEDLCIDVPRAGDYAAVVIGALMANDIVPLSVFCSLPEESTFSAFYKSPELIIHSVKEMCSGEGGTSKAKAAYEAAEGLPQLLLANIATGPKQDPADALKELVAKANIPFALSPQ
jgi:translation initiation factor 4G